MMYVYKIAQIQGTDPFIVRHLFRANAQSTFPPHHAVLEQQNQRQENND